MRVLVLGSGVIGVASAYYLNRAGHEVAVVDRQPQPARETSYANGGQVSWSHASPWAAPGIPLKALKWVLRRHSPLVLRLRFDPKMWGWLLRMIGNCNESRYLVNKERMLRLARYSHACLQTLRAETGIEYQQGTRGTLQLFREQRDLDATARDAAMLEHLGIPCRAVDRAGCVALEPGLRAAQDRIAGGVHFSRDELGDCRLFTERLARLAQANGVRFVLATTIERLVHEDGRITHVVTDGGAMQADACVLALGSYSPRLVQPLGLRLPVIPVKGYSVTLPVINDHAAPQSTLTDETYKMVISRLGDRIRVAGTAELAGYDLSLPAGPMATLRFVIGDLFPGAGDLDRAEYWCGLRPMTPDNPPLLGATPYRNLYLNTGHGTLGWTMACGSGRVVADIVSGRTPEIDLSGLTLARCARS